MNPQTQFDVIVVGGGHAGVEAALAAARSGASTLMITHNIETIGQMSCNPAIGGIGKSHLVKEIDALGGAMARAADLAGIHFRVLNSRKGPAVRATRAQTDRQLYRMAIRKMVEEQQNLSLFQQAVSDLVVEGQKVTGVVTQMGLTFAAQTVILATGTFLGGTIHVGREQTSGGRAGDAPSIALAERLRTAIPHVGRLKTGTPPRIASNSLDYTQFSEQPGDSPRPVFSSLSTREQHPEQRLCYIAHTNTNTHAIIRQALDQSPIYNGTIDSQGPRYCPSIEDKVVRFAQKDAHQIFIEPEGLHSNEVYPNGISTSLPFEVQIEMVRSMAGFENAHITRPGYAIEYDYFEPLGLYPHLETKVLENLFFAGQINGTTGYEEAAAQGLIAGINASLKVQGRPAWYPHRNQAYIGVMIDDLVTRGTNEPYRMFTSRAEYRLLLRQDNADTRLTAIGRELNLVGDQRWQVFQDKLDALEKEEARLKNLSVSPQQAAQHDIVMQQSCSALDLLRRPQVRYADLIAIAAIQDPITNEQAIDQLEAQTKYSGYLPRQEKEALQLEAIEQIPIPQEFDYTDISGLSAELQSKLSRFRPTTLGQASRIQGMTPCALSLLQLHLKSANTQTTTTDVKRRA